jgi:hypothetical protein
MTLRPLLVKCFPVIFGTVRSNSNPNSETRHIKSKSWGQKAAEKLRGPRSKETLDGDETLFVETRGSTMTSNLKEDNPEVVELHERTLRAETPVSDMERILRTETTISDVESMEQGREVRGRVQTFSMHVSRVADPSP